MSVQSLLRVSEIKIKNFRSFYGEKEPILLSTDKKSPVTVIHGTSGKGKTTLLNAIHWCIYNKEGKIKQKKSTSEGLIHSAVVESLKPGEEESMYVQITIEDENHNFVNEIRREIKIIKSSTNGPSSWNEMLKAIVPSGIIAESNASFTYKDPDTDEPRPISGEANVNERIEQIFPNALSAYILFDAELLRKFEDENESSIIQDGIETITGLPIIEKAADKLDQIAKKTTKTNVASSIKFQSTMKKVERLDKGIKALEKENIELGKKILESKQAEEEKVKFLLENDDEKVAERAREEQKVDGQVKALAEVIKKIKKDMSNSVFDNLINYYLCDSLIISQKKLEKWRNKGLVPSRFTKEALQSLLEEQLCVCGRELKDEHNNEIDKIKDTMNKVYEAAIASEMGTISNEIDEIINETNTEKSKELEGKYEKLKDDLADARSKRASLKSELAKIRSEKDDKWHDKVVQVKRELNELRNEIDGMKAKMATNNTNLNIYKPEFKEVDKEYQKLTKSAIKDDVHGNKIKLSIFGKSVFKQTSESLEKFFKTNVEAATQEYFLNTAPEKEAFIGVKIDDDTYAISAVRKGDKEKEISQGQAHCLGLSYIAGVRKVTSKNYFMMIDSPFHNISQDSKLQVCVELPTKMDTTQVTFFCTDTEYRAQVPGDEFDKEDKPSAKDVLKQNQLIGIQYNLVKKSFEMNGETYFDTEILEVKI
jgi:DNA sulfur modification protein DndD